VQKDLLFKKLCTPQSIGIGWHLAHGDSRSDFATDPLGYADYALTKSDRFRFIIEQIRDQHYRFTRLTDIDIPKSGLSVRPGNVLPIEESTILHAIVYLIAPKIDPKLHKGVYSYRLAKDWKKRSRKANSLFHHADVANIPFLKRRTLRSINIEEPWYAAWPEFDAASIRAVKKRGFTHLTKTDITAYFENIELSTLASLLNRYLPTEPAIVDILTRILHYWTRHTQSGIPIGRGIPQGNNVSSFLGNIYLIPLDEELERFCQDREAVWFRYVDDVKVFTKRYEDARDAVFLISQVLRQLHLNLQGSKTEILTGVGLEEELFDSDLEIMNVLISKLNNGKKPLTMKQITKVVRSAHRVTVQFTSGLPYSVATLDSRESRLFRRSLTLFTMARRPQMRKASIHALRHLPDLRVLRSTLRYLTALDPKYHDETLEALFTLLDNHELPFSYQVAETIESIKFLSPSDPSKLASRLRQLGFRKNSHWYVRQKTVETVSVLPYREPSVERFATHALEDESPWVRRAGAVLAVRGGIGWVRKKVDLLCYHADPDVARIGLYWKRHLDDPQYVGLAFGGLPKGMNDRVFIRRLPMIYLLRCHQETKVGNRLYALLESVKSKNSVIKWHRGSIMDQLSRWLHPKSGTLPFEG
jgi:hypothetical protein